MFGYAFPGSGYLEGVRCPAISRDSLNSPMLFMGTSAAFVEFFFNALLIKRSVDSDSETDFSPGAVCLYMLAGLTQAFMVWLFEGRDLRRSSEEEEGQPLKLCGSPLNGGSIKYGLWTMVIALTGLQTATDLAACRATFDNNTDVVVSIDNWDWPLLVSLFVVFMGYSFLTELRETHGDWLSNATRCKPLIRLIATLIHVGQHVLGQIPLLYRFLNAEMGLFVPVQIIFALAISIPTYCFETKEMFGSEGEGQSVEESAQSDSNSCLRASNQNIRQLFRGVTWLSVVLSALAHGGEMMMPIYLSAEDLDIPGLNVLGVAVALVGVGFYAVTEGKETWGQVSKARPEQLPLLSVN